MDEGNNIASILHSLQNQIEDLEIRVNEILVKQLQTKRELDLIQEKPEDTEDVAIEEKIEVAFPEDYHFTEDLDRIMENMIAGQKAWMESVHETKDRKTGLKGLKFFDEMNKHLSDRLEYLKRAKNLIQGPLLEELPPPPEEPPEVEEPKEEKEKKTKKSKKK